MPIVLISPERMREQTGPYTDLLREAGFEIRYPRDPTFARGLGSEQETIKELRGIQATLASVEHYSRRVLAELPELRVIARTGVGYDKVDVPAATERRIAVTITPNANHEAVAELALSLMFAVAKSALHNDRQVRLGAWPRRVLAPLRRRTLGIVGLGRIGRSTAIRAKALGMTVIAAEQNPDPLFLQQQAIELVEFDDLLGRSDYISLHCPLNEQTQGLFDQEAFARMKPGSVLINTARGKLVVEADLCQALESGHLKGAGLDVFEEEPPSVDNPLLKLDNVVLSPHMAGADEESSAAMAMEAAQCIVRLYQGEWPQGSAVNDSLQDTWQW